ncbi:RNA 2'-phosphotransferase [Burkholderia cenocepacia]|uniref:2'-phosphotransferase n=1 Tax=Burkholderia cenocepacia TaxID=95486 RepID=UPI001861FE99|nr:2'-phosphotransferase [Burkholderia cenocepacia]QND96482.1 RNA 2'-phosphotransferase [Burkholderia cenocepacia]
MQFSASKSATMGKPDAGMCKDEGMADSEDRRRRNRAPAITCICRRKSGRRGPSAHHGVPAILAVEAQRMHRQGHTFFVAENGVRLTDAVPAECLPPIDTRAD